jgi:23S rRNA (cytosine1962-C5)-methyltransferase
MQWPDYELLDFGAGRRLERFGPVVVDRPCPAAEHVTKQRPALWRDAVAKYDGDRTASGKWSGAKAVDWPDLDVPLSDRHAIRVRLSASPAGQVGLFPEQFPNWRWLCERLQRSTTPLKILNLFAYTGGSTLAAAVAGAEVTHVDASKPSVAIARANAELSGLAAAPIRWIVEDALKYCEREVRRGMKYDGVILDPPSYGHGPKGEEWSVHRDLPKLLALCRQLTGGGQLTAGAPRLLLATCHTPGIGPAELSALVSDSIFGSCRQPPTTGELFLATASGRKLPSGIFARI